MASSSTPLKHTPGLLALATPTTIELEYVVLALSSRGPQLRLDGMQYTGYAGTQSNHGLTTHAPGSCGLKDHLPEQFPTARIFTYGYDAGIWFNGSTKTIEKEGVSLLTDLQAVVKPGCLVIFICHSMGGILLKEAMVTAHNKRHQYGSLLQHPKVAVFMATPHDGSKIATSVSLLFKIPGINKRHINDLRIHSESLQRLSNNFDEHHSSICKFPSKDDNQLRQVVNTIKTSIEKVKSSVNMTTTDFGRNQTVPQYPPQGEHRISGTIQLEQSPSPTYGNTNFLSPIRHRDGWTPTVSPRASNSNLSLSFTYGRSGVSSPIDDNASRGSSMAPRSPSRFRNSYPEALNQARREFQKPDYKESFRLYKRLFEQLRQGDWETEVLGSFLRKRGVRSYANEEMARRSFEAAGDTASPDFREIITKQNNDILGAKEALEGVKGLLTPCSNMRSLDTEEKG
ncbi:hypothetical protein V8F06_004448 [Rhypophila decipiens]